MISKILFATDLSPFTHHALAHVETLATQFDAQVSVVHAVTPLSDFTQAIVKSYCSKTVKREVLKTSNIKGIIESVRDKVFDIIAANHQFDNKLLNRLSDVVIVPGKPVPTILFEAERLQVDIIVIGTHGADTIDDHVLGSVASKVLQLSKVPVYLVPMAHMHEATGLSREGLQNLYRD